MNKVAPDQICRNSRLGDLRLIYGVLGFGAAPLLLMRVFLLGTLLLALLLLF